MSSATSPRDKQAGTIQVMGAGCVQWEEAYKAEKGIYLYITLYCIMYGMRVRVPDREAGYYGRSWCARDRETGERECERSDVCACIHICVRLCVYRAIVNVCKHSPSRPLYDLYKRRRRRHRPICRRVWRAVRELDDPPPECGA